jgi:hypothetical protein
MGQPNSPRTIALTSTFGIADREKFRDLCSYLSELCDELSKHNCRDLGSSSFSTAADRADLSANHTNPKHARRTEVPSIDKLASNCYAERRLRDQIFNDSSLFGEPAWDILLDVANAEAKGKRLSVSSVCIGSCAPASTALRWLGILEERDLLRREEDVLDRRRSYIRLTRNGAGKLWKYFEGLSRAREADFRIVT